MCISSDPELDEQEVLDSESDSMMEYLTLHFLYLLFFWHELEVVEFIDITFSAVLGPFLASDEPV
jgi:hypothetical protein